MPAAKKTETVKRKTTPKNKKEKVVTETKKIQPRSAGSTFKTMFVKLKFRTQDFLARRPHRSFRRTRRRDYVRPLKMPGYFSFTYYVLKTLGSQKKLFIGIVIIYGILSALFVGLASQQTYLQLSSSLETDNKELLSGSLDGLTKAGLLLAASVTGGLNSAQATNMGIQQIVLTILALLFTWLTTVWLLRAILAGQKPRLRDGVYSSGSPIIPTFLVSLMTVLQLLPVAVVVIALAAALNTGLLEGGVESMVFWAFALLLIALSLYWMTSTFMALVVVTLPGMYPVKALRIAGDLVIGRRIRILLRLLWGVIFVGSVWMVVMIPIILLDGWIKTVVPAISWMPIVPLSLLVMSSLSVVWMASYVYLLYRKVVDDDAAPA